MKKIVLSIAAMATALTAPLSAQFQAWTAPNNSGTPFWDHTSDDGDFCNVGYVLNGTAGTAGNECINQRPSGWLPYSGSTPTGYWGTASGGWAAFTLNPGTYTFSLLPGVYAGGDIAGANQDWGYWESDGAGGRTNFHNLNTSGIPVAAVTFGNSWGLWIDLYNGGGMAYSDQDPQFAAFQSGSSIIFGLADNDGTGSDRDYQDELFQVTSERGGVTEVVPEPASMTLLATGLVGLAGMTRRRRKQK